MSTRNHIKLGTHIVTRVVVKKSTPPRSSPRFLLSPPLPCSAWSRSAPPPPPPAPQRLVKVGSSVKTAFGGQAQDIEGVVSRAGELYVVQARPQVL